MRTPTYIEDTTILRAPAFSLLNTAAGPIALDPSSPNWVASDDRGVRLLGQFDGRTPFADVVKHYAASSGLDATRAWLHVETFARDAVRRRVSLDQRSCAGALSRARRLSPDGSPSGTLGSGQRFLQPRVRALSGVLRPIARPRAFHSAHPGRDRSGRRAGSDPHLFYRRRTPRPTRHSRVVCPRCRAAPPGAGRLDQRHAVQRRPPHTNDGARCFG